MQYGRSPFLPAVLPHPASDSRHNPSQGSLSTAVTAVTAVSHAGAVPSSLLGGSEEATLLGRIWDALMARSSRGSSGRTEEGMLIAVDMFTDIEIGASWVGVRNDDK